MARFLWLTIVGLLTLTGCDSQLERYNAALLQMSEQDFAPAARSFSSLAENGYAPAQFRLGLLYLYGVGVPRNNRQAAYWLDKAARQDHVGGQYMLAKLYLDGVGVPRSAPSALRWFLQLAEQGYPPAQYQVGIMYEQGLGTSKDDAEAVRWLLQAAEHGYQDAMLKLAEAYQNGLLGLPQDSGQAGYWREQTKPKKF